MLAVTTGRGGRCSTQRRVPFLRLEPDPVPFYFRRGSTGALRHCDIASRQRRSTPALLAGRLRVDYRQPATLAVKIKNSAGRAYTEDSSLRHPYLKDGSGFGEIPRIRTQLALIALSGCVGCVG